MSSDSQGLRGLLPTATNIDSSYQISVYQQTAQRLTLELKAYLLAAVSHIDQVNRVVKEGCKQGQAPSVDLELDSVICGQLFKLSVAVSRSMKRDFSEFEKNIIEQSQAKFNTNEGEISTKYLTEIAESLKNKMTNLDDQRPQSVKYESFDDFLKGIPSKLS